MFVIKNEQTGKFAKHTEETNSDGYYVEYPWKMVETSDEAQQYSTREHANEVAFWHLDSTEKWLVINIELKTEHEIATGKYLP